MKEHLRAMSSPNEKCIVKPRPMAFMSYARLDDEHGEGWITEFRQRLSKAVSLHIGEQFEIFQDRDSVKWGQDWKERIDGSLEATTFLVAMITSRFFKSACCREELGKFLERERRLDRSDLVLPVYYVDVDERMRSQDPLAQAVMARQFADWRNLRFEQWNFPQVGRTLDEMARQIAAVSRQIEEGPSKSIESAVAIDHSSDAKPTSKPAKAAQEAKKPPDADPAVLHPAASGSGVAVHPIGSRHEAASPAEPPALAAEVHEQPKAVLRPRDEGTTKSNIGSPKASADETSRAAIGQASNSAAVEAKAESKPAKAAQEAKKAQSADPAVLHPATSDSGVAVHPIDSRHVAASPAEPSALAAEVHEQPKAVLRPRDEGTTKSNIGSPKASAAETSQAAIGQASNSAAVEATAAQEAPAGGSDTIHERPNKSFLRNLKTAAFMIALGVVIALFGSFFATDPKKPREVTRDSTTGMELVWVPKGCFQMGSPPDEEGRYSDEGPAHEVCVDGMWLGRHEVTQGQWERVMGSNPSSFKGEKLPVENVSWNDVQEFVARLNAKTGGGWRLPTEAEWEHACRAGGPGPYCGGSDLDAVAWHRGNSGGKTHPVGTRQANGLGLHDMSGNVWEWCSDWHGADYYQQQAGDNPQGPGSGSFRVARGGSWFNFGRCCRSAIRFGLEPASRNGFFGFRLARGRTVQSR